MKSLKTRNEIIENEESDERYILGKGEMIIGIDTNKPPLSYLDDGELTGFEIEFAKAVCSRLSIDVVFKEIKWNMRETELNSKSIDCVWNSFTVTEERRKTIEFSRVYMNNRQVVVIKKSDTSKFPDAKSLSGAKMSAGVDTTGEEALLGDPDLSQSEYIVSSSQNDAIYGLISGLYDAIVIDYTSAKGYITDDDSELMIIEGISLQEEQYAVGFRHGSDIIKRINDVFLDMILDGSLSTLVKKYNLYELFLPYEISDANYIMNNGKMIIGIQGNVPPMSYYDENGELTGFDIEFARAACQQLGIDAEFKTIFWDKKESDLKKRNIDCIWNTLTVTDDRRDNIKFTRIYMSNKQVVMIKKSDASIYSDLKSLTKAKISAETKSTGEETIQNDTYLSQSEYVYSASMEKAIEALKNDEVDAIVIDYTVAQNNIVNENSDLMIIDEINFGEELYAVGFRINSDMTIKINELINNMINDGSLKSLANKFNLGDLYTSALERDETSDMDYIMTKGQMTIGIESNTPPLMYYDEYGQITGFNIEFAKAVCYELNIDVIFKDIDWENKDNELNSKSIDCLWNALTITEERHNYFAFSHAYLNNKQVIVVRTSDASKFTDVKSFVNTKISAEAGTTGEDEILNNLYFSQAKYTASASQDEAILALINGEFDAIVIDYTLAKGTIAKKYPDLTIFEGIGLQEEQYGVGFRFGSDMAKKVDNVILDMITDGTLGNLAKKYDLIELFKPIRITDYDYIMGNGKLVIGYEGMTPPMNYLDGNGQFIGFDVEFARLVCQQFGIEPEFKEIDWNTKEIDLKERKIDCIWNSLTVTDERREDMKFSRIYMSNKLVVLINKSNASKYTDLKSLSGEKLSFESSSTAEKAIRNNRYLSKTEFIEVPSQNDAILALKSGKADAIVIDYTMAVNSISHDSSELMFFSDLNTEEEMYAIGFRLGTDMTIKVNEIINKMMNDGTLESLAKKYNLNDLYNSVIKNDNQSDYDYIMAKGEMNIGIEINSPPMNYYDEYGDLIGFDCELAEAICSKLGINAIFVNIEWDMKETLLNNKTIDCIWSSLTVTEERRNYFSFSQPYLSNRPAVIIKKSDASKFTDVESLSTSTISAENESTGEEAILNDPYLSHSNYIVSYSLAEAINGLKNGDFDAIVTDYTLAKGTIADGNEDLMIVKGIRFQEEQYAVGFRLNSDMTQKVNDMIMDMILEDSLTDLSEKYDLVELFTPIKTTDSEYIIKNGKIIIGFDGTLSPMTFYNKNNELTGFDIDFAKAVCQQLDIKVEFKEINWDQKETDLKKRNIDCIWGGLSVTDERRERIKFSRVYMNNKQVVVIRKSNIFKYTVLDSLSESKLGSKTGSLGEDAIETYLPHANYKGFFSIEEMFTELKKGMLDAIVIDYTIAKDNINNNGFTDLMIIESIELIDDQYAIGFRYGSDMSQKVNGIIKTMMSDGSLNEIAKKYDLLNLYTKEIKSKNYFMIIIILIVYSFLIIIA